MRDSQCLVFGILLLWVGEQVLYARFCITSLMTLCVCVPQCFRFCFLRFGTFFFFFPFYILYCVTFSDVFVSVLCYFTPFYRKRVHLCVSMACQG